MSENYTLCFWSNTPRAVSAEGRPRGGAKVMSTRRGTTGEAGIRIFREMLAGAPRPFDYHRRALALQLRGRFEEAEQQYRAALKSEPRNVYTLNNLGALLLRTGQTAPAVKLIRKAIQADPSYEIG